MQAADPRGARANETGCLQRRAPASAGPRERIHTHVDRGRPGASPPRAQDQRAVLGDGCSSRARAGGQLCQQLSLLVVIRTAPAPAGPGLPRAAPSAYRTTSPPKSCAIRASRTFPPDTNGHDAFAGRTATFRQGARPVAAHRPARPRVSRACARKTHALRDEVVVDHDDVRDSAERFRAESSRRSRGKTVRDRIDAVGAAPALRLRAARLIAAAPSVPPHNARPWPFGGDAVAMPGDEARRHPPRPRRRRRRAVSSGPRRGGPVACRSSPFVVIRVEEVGAERSLSSPTRG